jgi:hypothetical protein
MNNIKLTKLITNQLQIIFLKIYRLPNKVKAVKTNSTKIKLKIQIKIMILNFNKMRIKL